MSRTRVSPEHRGLTRRCSGPVPVAAVSASRGPVPVAARKRPGTARAAELQIVRRLEVVVPWYTSGMKTAVSIPDPLFRAADRLAKRLHMSRSRLYSVAVERFLQASDDAAITAKLNEVLASESSALDPVLQSIQARSIAKDQWK